jgi:hypothetical protein
MCLKQDAKCKLSLPYRRMCNPHQQHSIIVHSCWKLLLITTRQPSSSSTFQTLALLWP